MQTCWTVNSIITYNITSEVLLKIIVSYVSCYTFKGFQVGIFSSLRTPCLNICQLLVFWGTPILIHRAFTSWYTHWLILTKKNIQAHRISHSHTAHALLVIKKYMDIAYPANYVIPPQKFSQVGCPWLREPTVVQSFPDVFHPSGRPKLHLYRIQIRRQRGIGRGFWAWKNGARIFRTMTTPLTIIVQNTLRHV